VATQIQKAETFQQLHAREGTFVIPNPWDAGTARLLTGMGFPALATTSAGLAFALGRPDGHGAVSQAEALQNAKDIVDATDLPVSADLEGGYGDDAATAAETTTLAAAAGLVGGSIEDATGRSDEPIYPIELAAERVRAAAEAARALPFKFMLVGRAENYLHGRPDLDDTIKRLQAYQEAGADVLYAPGLRTKADIAQVVRAVDRPLNVLMGLAGCVLTVKDLAEIGVRRVSVGSVLSRAALGGFLKAAEEIQQKGTFTFAEEAPAYGTLNAEFED
jgi:2-methylisocitrate lyase-like PEP mutase family enzyme